MTTAIVTGAGVAGLTCATALRRAGWTVHLYERSALLNEVGAAIMVPPNAARPLLAWGMDPTRARAVVAREVFRAKGDTLDRFMEENFEGYAERFGCPWYWVHRVDLHRELMALAMGRREIREEEKEKQGMGSVTMHLESEVVGYDPLTPSITLKDGSVVTADLVVAADGVHSLGVQAVLGKPNPAHPQELYNFCYRFLIPKADVEADPETREWEVGDEGRGKFFIGEKKRIVWYPCRDNQVHNFVAIFHNEEHSSMKAEDWNTSVSKDKLLEKYSDFHPRLLAVLQKATEIKQYPLLYRGPIPTWTKGSMVLVGDASHPMLPHQGQGGAQAIEDGVALGIAMSGVTDTAQIPARIAAFEKIRRNRASVMQVFSNAGQDEAGLVEREAARYIPLEEVPKSPAEFHAYNLGYDIIGHSSRVLRETEPDFAIPKGFFAREPLTGTALRA